MTRDDVIAKLQVVFDDIFVENIVVTAELTADEVEEWDSLVQVALIVAVEKAFAVRFSVGEVEATSNVGELADLIIKHSGKK